jgi:hypothetical protein
MKSHDHFLQIIPDDTFVLPAHNLPFYGVKTRLRDLISHHDDRLRAIEEVCVEPKDAKELLPVLFNRELGPPQMMMALGEAIAHVHLLLQRNRLERELDEHGVYKYRTINPGIRKQA